MGYKKISHPKKDVLKAYTQHSFFGIKKHVQNRIDNKALKLLTKPFHPNILLDKIEQEHKDIKTLRYDKDVTIVFFVEKNRVYCFWRRKPNIYWNLNVYPYHVKLDEKGVKTDGYSTLIYSLIHESYTSDEKFKDPSCIGRLIDEQLNEDELVQDLDGMTF